MEDRFEPNPIVVVIILLIFFGIGVYYYSNIFFYLISFILGCLLGANRKLCVLGGILFLLSLLTFTTAGKDFVIVLSLFFLISTLLFVLGVYKYGNASFERMFHSDGGKKSPFLRDVFRNTIGREFIFLFFGVIFAIPGSLLVDGLNRLIEFTANEKLLEKSGQISYFNHDLVNVFVTNDMYSLQLLVWISELAFGLTVIWVISFFLYSVLEK